MNVRNIVLLVAGLLMIGAISGCRPSVGDNVAAVFDGGVLTIEDLQEHRRIMMRKKVHRDNPGNLTPEFIFDHAVNMEMIIAKGLKEKLHLDPRIRAEIHGFMSDLFLNVMKDSLAPRIDRDKFTEEEVREYFDRNLDAYRPPARYGVRVIRHHDEAFLRELATQVASGEMSFETAARNYSTDEATRSTGGYVGPRPLNRYAPEWRKVISTLSLNDISPPVSVGDALYLFQVVEITEPPLPSFEEKKAYVRNDLLYARYREAWRQVYDELRDEFDLKVRDHALEKFLSQEDGNENKPL
jgi:hypothetical protein